MTEFEKEKIHACGEYIEKHKPLNDPFCYQVGFFDACDWANTRAEKKVQVLVEALEMAKFCMNAFIEKVPQTDLVTRDLMQIEVNRYSEALAEYRGEK